MTPSERLLYWVREKVPAARRAHQDGVVSSARALAVRFGIDPARAELAAWLHDAGRYLPPAVQRQQLEGRAEVEGTPLDEAERRIPELWHAPVSALFGRLVMGITDAEVLRAARLHTTGGPSMGNLELAVYVADYIEPSRTHECRTAREAATRDLRAAAGEVVRGKIGYLRREGREVHPRSLAFAAELGISAEV